MEYYDKAIASEICCIFIKICYNEIELKGVASRFLRNYRHYGRVSAR